MCSTRQEALGAQARGVTDWRRERGWEMLELKDRLEMECKLQFHSRLILVKRKFASLKVCSLKVRMEGTYCNATPF